MLTPTQAQALDDAIALLAQREAVDRKTAAFCDRYGFEAAHASLLEDADHKARTRTVLEGLRAQDERRAAA